MPKTIYTLNIPPQSESQIQKEIINLTFPLIEKWAWKIDADFVTIEKPIFNKPSPTYEKFQIFELSQQRNDDYSIFIDSDMLLMPSLQMPDWSELFGGDTVWSWAKEHASVRYKLNDWFRRDGRFIAIGSFFYGFSRWTRDYAAPLDQTWEWAMEQIYPSQLELNYHKEEKSHYIDDFWISCNLSRYGLKYKAVQEEYKKISAVTHLWHNYLFTPEDKLNQMQEILQKWGE